MYFLYSLLLAIGFVILIPRFLWDALNHGKYVTGFGERLGNLPQLANSTRPRIWIHCVSVGETQAARPLVSALRRRFPSHNLVVSTTTLTGQKVARDVFRNDAEAVFYFPFDWAWTTRRVLRKVNPAVVLLMETELWPRLLRECRKREVPISIVNGRISATSYRRYKWIRSFVTRVLNDLSFALMQSEPDAERIRQLGMEPQRVTVTGNLKFDLVGGADEQSLTAELRTRFGFNDRDRLIVAASTHDTEERLILEALRELKDAGHNGLRLVIAPRHPERFSNVATVLDSSRLNWIRRTSPPAEADQNCDVVLLDTVGELLAVYPLASVVFVGGSISPNGGHNILEPAASGACVVTGAHTANFSAIVSAFVAADAIVQLADVSAEEAPKQLAKVFKDLLADGEGRQRIGLRGQALCESNRGATERTIDLLAPLLNDSADRKTPAQTYTSHPALVSK
ncbi:MAG: 3-deoxy-D-manno-octulosonic-acid transferase [Blastocatellia bacterium]|jgi:3-deoxy-D-manno-octulosonic-acid transferase|nr:3-deoxy-D-manno-octulosonic-acid transferase [Blastocatellia bacterium]